MSTTSKQEKLVVVQEKWKLEAREQIKATYKEDVS